MRTTKKKIVAVTEKFVSDIASDKKPNEYAKMILPVTKYEKSNKLIKTLNLDI